ncbi:GNAT family N-acetyltransferase [Thaumasiovibrio subtropicus]|uniref:GNAT family N-acetyltransferase n=1 Tax=Thaumasiovibrio subtropicus TaxID=1891207 RepID=UPI000B363D19|nr:GNAT family protein [Thaumasiovibrio subtropicus]
MFREEVDSEISLALVEPSFATQYHHIVLEQKAYLGEWLPWVHFADGEPFFMRFIKQSLYDYADGKSLTCGILFKGDLVGNISFNNIQNTTKRVEIGYWLSEKYQGQGIMSRSVSHLIHKAFNEMKMEKVQIAAAEHNKPSRALCERLGFKLEGILTNTENINGYIVNHAFYGLHREDWQQTR